MNIAVLARESSERAENAGEVEQNVTRENHPVAHTLEPDPIEIDPRPCVCGYTINQHLRVDTPEGPEFCCQDIEADELAYNLVRDWELVDPRDRWRHTAEPPPPASVRNSDISVVPAKTPQYRTPQSTVDAFFFVLKTKDAAGIAAWLAAHPRDERHLQKIWEQKCSTAAAK
jgi:hypothetical protein